MCPYYAYAQLRIPAPYRDTKFRAYGRRCGKKIEKHSID